MRLIDVLNNKIREAAEAGLRPCGIKLDVDAQDQLKQEASDDGSPLTGSDPVTFRGLPLLPGNMALAEMLFVAPGQRFVTVERQSPRHNARWDIFDLDGGRMMGAFFMTKDEADAHRITLERELAEK
jgi:hypothetical protein